MLSLFCSTHGVLENLQRPGAQKEADSCERFVSPWSRWGCCRYEAPRAGQAEGGRAWACFGGQLFGGPHFPGWPRGTSPSHCLVILILMELDVPEGTPILLFLSSDSLAPLITEIVIQFPPNLKPPNLRASATPLPSPRSPVLHNSTVPLIVPGEIFDYERVKVDCITCWFT